MQGPVGPFFGDFLAALTEAGYDPVKINFNGGDWFFARGSKVINYRGKMDQWESWFRSFVAENAPAFIILMGDERPIHATALKIAREADIPVWVLEEGYIRPDFVACELYGTNANSPLLKKAIEAVPAATPHRKLPRNTFPIMAVYATLYYWGLALGKVFFPHYKHHRARSLVIEFFLWNRNLLRKKLHYKTHITMEKTLVRNHHRKLYVVALQVDDDMQLLAHGRGWTNVRLIREAIRSFAAHAPEDTRLVFKGHPLNRGHFSLSGYIREMARESGCGERVVFVDDGSIAQMIRHSLGLITINSTSGFSAIYHKTPLMCLGNAMYDRPGLTHHFESMADMNEFWRAPKKPDPVICDKFLAMVRHDCLVNGTFYDRDQFGLTFTKLIAKIGTAQQIPSKTTPA